MSRNPVLAFRSLLARPSRTLFTLLGVVLGVAVILAISITNLSTLDSIITLFNEASGKAHLVVTSSTTGDQGFREDTLRRVVTVPGVKAAIPSLQVQASLADEASSSQVDISLFGAASGGLVLYGIDSSLDPQAREYKVVAGQFLSAGSTSSTNLMSKAFPLCLLWHGPFSFTSLERNTWRWAGAITERCMPRC